MDYYEIEKKENHTIEELFGINKKLKNTTLSQEEKSTLIKLFQEKIKEYGTLRILSKETPKPEYKPKTREEEIEEAKTLLEEFKKVIEDCKKNNDISLLNKMLIVVEQ